MTYRLTREELYELVWGEPITRLAKTFGVSDVAVSKACKRANIPRPPRGYWARKRAGKNAPKVGLPHSAAGLFGELEPGMSCVQATNWRLSSGRVSMAVMRDMDA